MSDKSVQNVICREIIQEIHKFGVTQYQIKKLIHLLSLELESRELMLELVDVITKELDDE